MYQRSSPFILACTCCRAGVITSSFPRPSGKELKELVGEQRESMRRAILLLTVVTVMLLAFSGVVLAQQGAQTPSSQEKSTADPAERSTGKAGERVPGKYI